MGVVGTGFDGPFSDLCRAEVDEHFSNYKHNVQKDPTSHWTGYHIAGARTTIRNAQMKGLYDVADITGREINGMEDRLHVFEIHYSLVSELSKIIETDETIKNKKVIGFLYNPDFFANNSSITITDAMVNATKDESTSVKQQLVGTTEAILGYCREDDVNLKAAVGGMWFYRKAMAIDSYSKTNKEFLFSARYELEQSKSDGVEIKHHEKVLERLEKRYEFLMAFHELVEEAKDTSVSAELKQDLLTCAAFEARSPLLSPEDIYKSLVNVAQEHGKYEYDLGLFRPTKHLLGVTA
jgi:hypothetical protein